MGVYEKATRIAWWLQGLVALRELLRFWGSRPYSVSLMGYTSFCDSYLSTYYLRGVSHEITSLL